MVTRPVDVSPPQSLFALVDPVTGRATPTFQRFLLNLWERTGGFTDEFFQILSVSNLGAIQGLIATGQNEALARTLNDVAIQGRLDGIDRVAGQLEALQRQFSALQGVSTSALSPQPKTRVVIFDADDVYSAGSDVRSIDVYVIGGGGGGGRGSIASKGGGGGGGGGGGFTNATMNAATLPETVAVVVGDAGHGGSNGGGSATASAGGYSAFGDLLYANGGKHGITGIFGAGGAAGAVTTLYGNLYQGGPGSAGDLITPPDAPNDYQGAPGGGGGGGFNNGSGGAGGAGSWRSLTATGGGGAGGAAGASGAPGSSAGDSDVYFAPGYGGGGGGGALTGDGGDGADGVVGGGGGGGGAIGSGGTVPGVGGNGGAGRVIVVEHL